MEKIIYVDNAATTKTSKKVIESMKPYFSEIYGNPSSLHSIGLKAKKALDKPPPPWYYNTRIPQAVRETTVERCPSGLRSRS